MAHGISIKSIGEHGAGTKGGNTSKPDIEIPSRMGGMRPTDSRSGTWKITWHGGSDPNNVYVRTFHSLFERQLNTFASPRVFLLGEVQASELAQINTRASLVAVGEAPDTRGQTFDLVWDAGLLSRAQLPERLRLVQALDRRLEVGGSCVIVTHGERAIDEALASLSPEEVAAYFFPAYVVARHEEHEFALPPGRPVAFHTLVLVKQYALTSEMLDPELHRSLHAVASRRNGVRS